MSSFLASALAYAERGWPVFPLKVRSKEPATAQGFKDASTDPDQIRAWWAAMPDANIGIPTGSASGLFVVDLDDKDGRDGSQHWSDLAAMHGGDGAPLEHNTGSGGLHLVYRHVEGLRNSAGKLGVGIDTRGEGGYIVAAPSVHPSGGRYVWGSGALTQALELPPGWAVEKLLQARLPDAPPVRIEGSHTLTREDLEAFIAFKSRFPDAEAQVIVARAVLDGTSWGYGARHDRMVGFLGALRTFVLDKHGAALDPASSSVLFDGCTAAATAEGVKDPTDRNWVAGLIAALEGNDEAYRGKLEASRAAKKADIELAASRLLDGMPDVAVPEQDSAPAQVFHPYVKPEWAATPIAPTPVINEVIELLAAQPDVFCNNQNQLARVITIKGEEVVPIQVVEAGSEWLRERLCDLADWWTIQKKERVYVQASPSTVAMLLDRRAFPGVRDIKGVALSPFFRTDGTLCVRDGYDTVSGQWLCLKGLELPEIAERPSQADAVAAVGRLKHLLHDFEFTSPGMTSIWLSMLLTPLARPLHSPVHHADATNPGTGKGLFCESAMRIAIGRKVTTNWPGDADEQGKIITSAAVSGAPVVWLDNISPAVVLGGAAIEGAVSDGATGRVLGSSEMAPPIVRTTFISNGNNVRMSPDIARRTLKATIVANCANPAARDTRTFKHPRLKDHITENRGQYLADALTVLRAYYAAGKPVQVTQDISFSEWSRDVASAIVWAGEPDPAQYLAALAETADETTEALAELIDVVETLSKTNERGSVKAGQLLMISEDRNAADNERLATALFTLGLGQRADHRAFGQLLRKYEGRIVKVADGRELCLQRVRNNHSNCWEFTARPPARKR